MNEAVRSKEPGANSGVTEAEPEIFDSLIEKSTQPDLPDGSAISSRLESLFPQDAAEKLAARSGTDEPVSAQSPELDVLEVVPLEIEAESGSNETMAIAEFNGEEIDLQTFEDERKKFDEPAEKRIGSEPVSEMESITVGMSATEDLVIEDNPALALEEEMQPAGSSDEFEVSRENPGENKELFKGPGPEESESDLFETSGSASVTEADPSVDLDSAEQAAADDSLPAYILTPTLAEIYFMQGQLQRGLGIYRQLLLKDPANALYKQRIGEIEKAITSGGEATSLSGPERGKASRKAGTPSQPESRNRAGEPGSKG